MKGVAGWFMAVVGRKAQDAPAQVAQAAHSIGRPALNSEKSAPNLEKKPGQYRPSP